MKAADYIIVGIMLTVSMVFNTSGLTLIYEGQWPGIILILAGCSLGYGSAVYVSQVERIRAFEKYESRYRREP